MTDLEALEQELKQLIVDALRLEDVAASDIGSEEPLFDGGLGLDSIDALELGMTLSKKYGIKLSREKGENRDFFQNVRSLARMVLKLQQSPAQ